MSCATASRRDVVDCLRRRPQREAAAADADLSVSQVGPDTVAAGSTATFTALVVNTGRSDATNLVITETLTAGYTRDGDLHRLRRCALPFDARAEHDAAQPRARPIG